MKLLTDKKANKDKLEKDMAGFEKEQKALEDKRFTEEKADADAALNEAK